MNDPTLERHPIETLASEFTERLRAGEEPTVQEYIDGNPHVADEIRDLFPTIAAMEKLKTQKESHSSGRASLGPTRLEQLGDFRIVREIGRGGMGIVYEAEQLSLGRRVAVKVLPKQSLLDEKHLMRFRREAKTAARLHHTNIVPVLGVGEHDGFHFIVMQYIRGVGLDEIIPHLSKLGSRADSVSDPEAGEPNRREAQISSVAQAIFRGQFSVPAPVAESSIVHSPLETINDVVAESGSIGFEVGRLPNATHNSRHSPTRSFISNSTGNEENRAAEREIAPSELSATIPDDSPPDDSPPHVVATRMNTAYWRSVARIGSQVASALQYAHEHGTLHRDIKPGNLLIDQQGVVWVADFGLAKAMEQDDVSRTGDVVGTLRYMAPEQLFGAAEPRSDMFSLGLTLYEMLTFRPAYDEADRKKCLIQRSIAPQPPLPRRLVPSVPRDLETIVLKAIAEEPAQRYANSAELAEDLERFLEDRPILARRATPLEHLWRWCRRNPAVACLASIAASLLILVAIVSTTGYIRTRAANLATTAALEDVTRQRTKAEATSELAWNALDRIFARFAPDSVVSREPLTLETAEGVELAVESPVVLSDQAAALLEELLTFYDLLAAQGDNDVAFQRRIADANYRVGAIQHRLGRTDQATTAYLRAIEIYAEISSPSDDPKIRVAIASLHNELGTIHAQTRRYDEASDEFAMSRRLLQSLAARTDDPDVRYELAHTYYLQSWPFSGRRRRGPHRTDDLSQAIELLETLDEQYPNVPEYQQLLAMTYVERAERSSQDAESFTKAIGSAVSILTSLVDRFPNSSDFRFALATAYATEAPREDDRSAFERREEITRLTTSQSILKELRREHPNVPDYLATDAEISERIGKLYSRIFEFEPAITHLEAGLKTQELLARRHPSAARYHHMRLNFMRFTYANELRSQHDWTQDPRLLEKARDQLAATLPKNLEFMRSQGGDPRMKAFLARGILGTYESIGEVSEQLGDKDGAVAASEAAEAFRKKFKAPELGEGPRNGGPRTGGPRGGGSRGGRGRGDGGRSDAGRGDGEVPRPATSPDDTDESSSPAQAQPLASGDA